LSQFVDWQLREFTGEAGRDEIKRREEKRSQEKKKKKKKKHH
jgi:hypothetical protein